ncbi:MAG: UDP-N-acetylmuramoyl-L-alanine--D-glutamate ligase [Patescibacteria group bacterium]|nr:UDP-N-acetylmuramoyl-L-alanine--D-glutamate ligase [Patescibacteria group bacterium]
MREIVGNSVLILGYGREGTSVHKYIQTRYPSKRIGIADQNDVVPKVEGSVTLHVGKDYLNSLLNYDVIVRSPGIPFRTPELQKSIKEGKKVTSETNIFFSECSGMVIGITGTKGKSTTSSLIYSILQSSYPDVRLVGNIGKPALDYLADSNHKTVFVAELSSHQLEDFHYSPHIAVLLAIVPEHLSYHGSFPTYVDAKGNIVNYQSADDIVVFNPANHTTERLAEESSGQKFKFSSHQIEGINCYVKGSDIFVGPEFVMATDEIPLLGPGNIENVLAAISIGVIMGVDIEKIRKAIKEFKPLPHRLEYVGEKNGVSFYNDSLATIPEAAINALEALGTNVETLIAGGYDRGLDFSKLGEFLANNTALKTLILFPTTGEKIWAAVLKAIKGDNPIAKYDVSTMEGAMDIASAKTSPGKICLLSPASASFGVFRDYEERGNKFRELVNKPS